MATIEVSLSNGVFFRLEVLPTDTVAAVVDRILPMCHRTPMAELDRQLDELAFALATAVAMPLEVAALSPEDVIQVARLYLDGERVQPGSGRVRAEEQLQELFDKEVTTHCQCLARSSRSLRRETLILAHGLWRALHEVGVVPAAPESILDFGDEIMMRMTHVLANIYMPLHCALLERVAAESRVEVWYVPGFSTKQRMREHYIAADDCGLIPGEGLARLFRLVNIGTEEYFCWAAAQGVDPRQTESHERGRAAMRVKRAEAWRSFQVAAVPGRTPLVTVDGLHEVLENAYSGGLALMASRMSLAELIATPFGETTMFVGEACIGIHDPFQGVGHVVAAEGGVPIAALHPNELLVPNHFRTSVAETYAAFQMRGALTVTQCEALAVA